MDDTATKFLIGGATYEVPQLNFRVLQKVWPIFEQLRNGAELLPTVEICAEIVALAMTSPLVPPGARTLDKDGILDNLLGTEMELLDQSVAELFRKSGVLKDAPAGETPAAVAE